MQRSFVIMNKHYENIHRYDFLTKELIEKEYVHNEMSDAQIAKKYGISSKAIVWRKRKSFGIENRNPGKSNKHARTNRKYNITKDEAIQFLANNQNYQEIADHIGCSIIVVKRRFKELGLTKTQDHAEKYKYWDVELTSSQKQMLIGSTLGDGTIPKHGAYSCSHSIKQVDYLNHKMDILESIHSGKRWHAIHKAKGVDGKHFESYHFTTGCNKFCSDLRQIYYPNGEKIFPYDFLMETFTAEALAYWYMDDGTACWSNLGYKNNSSGAEIITLGFSFEEQECMKKLFVKKFDLDAKIVHRKDKNGYIQKFCTTNTSKLFDLVRPFFIPSLLYKIDHEVYKQTRKDKEELLKIEADTLEFGE